ncbi:MAG: ABC transporter ATP-binding protein/permease [Eggerthellaceae bacterium]
MIDKALFALPGIRRMLAVLLLLSIGRAGLIIGQAGALAFAITALWNGGSLEAQYPAVALFFCCFVAGQLLLFLEDRFMGSYADAQADALRGQLLEGVFATHAQVVRDHGTASVASAALEGADQVRDYLKAMLPKMAHLATVPALLLIAVFTQDIVSGIILLVLYPVIVFYMVLLGNAAKRRAERQFASYQAMSNHFIDTLRGLDTLRAFGAAKKHATQIFQVSERFRTTTVETLRVATLSGGVLDLIATVGVGAVAVMLGLRLMDGSMTLLPALAVLVLAPEYFRPIRDFASDFHASLDGKNALAHLQQLIRESQQRTDAAPVGTGEGKETDAVTAPRKPQGERMQANRATDAPAQPAPAPVPPEPASAQPEPAQPAPSPARTAASAASRTTVSAPDGTISPWTSTSHLSLENVSFAYAGADRNALTDVSLSVHGFEKIGIVGISGSGKSTLAGLLGGFNIPASGTLHVNGTETASLQRADWQHQVLYIPQDPYLFHDTLRANLRFYTPAADEVAMQRAVDAVGLQPLIDQLPQGLDTVIGDGGRGLSGGQAQRIALARALLDPTRRVLIFDEPTAHLDIETEYELKQRMLPLMQNRLVLFATHRLHWLAQMDRIVVMEDGRIAEQGTPAQLREADGALAQLIARMNPEGGRSHDV